MRSNYSMAEFFPERLFSCWNEQVYYRCSVNLFEWFQGSDAALLLTVTVLLTNVLIQFNIRDYNAAILCRKSNYQ